MPREEIGLLMAGIKNAPAGPPVEPPVEPPAAAPEEEGTK
jgi:hypothetical protein